MFVVQETKDIDGIEHKPLRIIGESDRIEVRSKLNIILKNMFVIVFLS